jgi:hypothetical protein
MQPTVKNTTADLFVGHYHQQSKGEEYEEV